MAKLFLHRHKFILIPEYFDFHVRWVTFLLVDLLIVFHLQLAKHQRQQPQHYDRRRHQNRRQLQRQPQKHQ